MRSSSRRPWQSKRHSSTLVALAENRAKFVPRPSQVGPSGYGEPAVSRALTLGDEKNCSKRGKDKADLGHGSFLQRIDASGVPQIAAAINSSIGVEHLAPEAGERHFDPIIAINLRC